MDILQYENYQEKEIPADPSFPYQTYLCSIPLDFTLVPIHWHDEMEIIYVKKGCGVISIDLRSFEVEEGDIIFVQAGQLHSIQQKEQQRMEYENIIFKLNLLFSRQSDACMEHYLLPLSRHQISLPDRLTPDTAGYAAIASCLDAIDGIRQTSPPAWELYIKGKLFELFYTLISVCAETASVPKTRQHQMEKTKQVLKYIEQHYAEKLSIGTIAGIVGFSQSHFMKFFKASLGTSFTSYLNDYRLAMAARLLLASEAGILEIAADTGFDNLSYFNRVFKKKFGVTPSDFRKTH